MIITLSKVQSLWVVAFSLALLCEANAAPIPTTAADAIRDIVTHYSPGEAKASKRAAADAFFEFEGSGLDRQLAARDPTLYRTVESEWMKLLSLMESGAAEDVVQAQGARVVERLGEGVRKAEGGGSVFFDSFLIILREGFEAILIVSALAAYLKRVGGQDRLRYLYGGACSAVLASGCLWLAARSVLDLGGSSREALEGWTVLVATAVLFWVSYWLVSKAEADHWQAFVRRRVEHAVGRGAMLGLGFLSFVVVFREGFETVLFYEAVGARAVGPTGQSMLLAGFLSGCVALAVLYALLQLTGSKIPMRAFFNITGGLLYFMAFRFAGAGIRELQEAASIPQTPAPWIPDSIALQQWLGLFPYLEPLLLQAVLLALAIFAMLHLYRGGQSSLSPSIEGRTVAAGRS